MSEVMERIVLGEGDIECTRTAVWMPRGLTRQGEWDNVRLVMEVLAPPAVPVETGQWRENAAHGPVHIDGPSQVTAGWWRWHTRETSNGHSAVDVESWPICDRPSWAVGPVVGGES